MITYKRPGEAFVLFAMLHLYTKKLRQLRNYLWPTTHNLRLGKYSIYGMRKVAASRDSTVQLLLTVRKHLSSNYYRNLFLFASPQHSTRN